MNRTWISSIGPAKRVSSSDRPGFGVTLEARKNDIRQLAQELAAVAQSTAVGDVPREYVG